MSAILLLVRRLLITAVLVALAAPAAAHAMTVGSGSLDWTMANVYDSSAARTYLGYVTSSGPPFTNGTASASNGASGATVTPSSPRGVDQLYTFSYGAATGSYDSATGAATVDLKGTVTFHSDVHGFTITVIDPQVVIGADRKGTLAANGATADRSSGNGGSYDRSTPVFSLDLSTATTTAGADGSTTISGIVPAIQHDIFSGYPVGSGPDRTPNTFGAFTLKVSPAPAAVPDPGTTTPTQTAPTTTTPTTTTPASTLDKAPATARVKGASRGPTVVLKLTRDVGKSATKRLPVRLRRNGKVIARGLLYKRLLTLHVRKQGKKGKRKTYPRIRGRFTLTSSNTKRAFGTIKLTVR